MKILHRTATEQKIIGVTAASQSLMKKDTGCFLSRNLASLCGPPELPGIGSGTLLAILPEHRDVAEDIKGRNISFKCSSKNLLATKEKCVFQKNSFQQISLGRKGEKVSLMVLANNSINRRNIGQHVPKWESRRRRVPNQHVCLLHPRSQGHRADGVEADEWS